MTTTTHRVKPTPTGVLILSSSAPREAWLAERKNGITATDISALMGASKYKNAIDVWQDKLNMSQDDTFEPAIGHMEAAFWGIELEEIVARKWAEKHGVKIRRIGIIAHEDKDWQRASIDRLVSGCKDGKCAVEVKTRSARVSDVWDRHIPDDVEFQVAWQLHVSGLDHIHVVALLGGQRLVEHVLHAKDISAHVLEESALKVWQAVQSGTPPELPEAMWTQDYLDAKFPNRDGEIEVQDADVMVAEFDMLDAEMKDLKARHDALKTKLIGALGEHEVALANGRPVYTYKAQSSRRLDSKALAELHPETASDDRIWNVTTSRVFRTTKKGN